MYPSPESTARSLTRASPEWSGRRLTSEGGAHLLQPSAPNRPQGYCCVCLLVDPSTNEVSPSACTSITPECPKTAICSHRTCSPSCNRRLPRSTASQVTSCPSGGA